MATQLETVGALGRKLAMAVVLSDIEREFGDRLRKLARTVKMPGFRPGKVPMRMIDTSTIRAAQLQGYVKSMMRAPLNSLSLVFQSFAFKRGVPLDADYVFDVRMLPNPHYESELRDLTGKDEAVIEFLRAVPEAARMEGDIAKFLTDWLDALVQNHRSYVNVAIGCTGGQHRSVYLVERLTERFASRWPIVTRHRELDAR